MTNVGNMLYEADILATLWAAFPFLVVDTDTGEIIQASPPAELVFGFDVLGGMVGLKIEDLVPEELREKHLDHRKAYAADPYPRLRPMGAVGMHLRGRRKTGELFQVEILLRPVVIRGRSCTLALVADMSGKLHLLDRGHSPEPPSDAA